MYKKSEDLLSAHRKSDPKRLSQIIRGELDWMVMKGRESFSLQRADSTLGEEGGDGVGVEHAARHEPDRLRPAPSRGKTRAPVAFS